MLSAADPPCYVFIHRMLKFLMAESIQKVLFKVLLELSSRVSDDMIYK
jgi:hypothetical protein